VITGSTDAPETGPTAGIVGCGKGEAAGAAPITDAAGTAMEVFRPVAPIPPVKLQITIKQDDGEKGIKGRIC
jgi:hypothetical protein